MHRASRGLHLALLLSIVPIVAPLSLFAQRPDRPPGAPPSSQASEPERSAERGGSRATSEVPKYVVPKPEEKIVTTHHQITLGGATIAYSATTGTLLLRQEDGRPKASVFFVYYSRDGVKDASKRPITYTFNGGPGSSSVWLHMGAFGPRRVVIDGNGPETYPPTPPAPPYRLVDNGESLLDVTDLVFIDPVSTGYSREAPGEDASQFHGFREDLESVGEFIRLWTVRFGRWESPKFLAGESYGTTRAAGLSHYLQERHGMYLNGVVLLSTILNFATARFDTGNDLPYMLFLPTYTATAWYHKKLPDDLQKAGLKAAVAEAERFATGEYNQALMLGSKLTTEQRRDVAAKLSRYTGLSAQYLESTNLRPTIAAFDKELLRDRRLTAGRLDSRYVGVDRTATGESDEFDPSSTGTTGPFTAMFNHYVADELGFKSDMAYEILTDRVRPWSYREVSNRYLNVAEDLRRAMAENPSLKIFVAKGYYDLATPFFAAEYTFDHLGYEPFYLQRITQEHYEAGHMMYIRTADRQKLHADVAAFIRAAEGVKP
ncbi:MAG TPA: peptidase S10 [Thermoanaerobaculia bacterium]|nr:peptidase S10 [Thermoanaerobaculia bacterium]